MGFHIVCDEISFAGTAAVISHFKLERKQESIVTPAYWSYTQYSIMTAANSPTYEAFIGQARLNIRVLLVLIVPSPSYSTPRRSPGTRKHTRRHATLRMNILWEVSELKKRRSYTRPGTELSISSVCGQESTGECHMGSATRRQER
jgi:hypothetical protein